MVVLDIDDVVIRSSEDVKRRFLVEGWDTAEVFSAAKEKAQSVICLTSRYSRDAGYTVGELAGRGITFDEKFSHIFKPLPYSLAQLNTGESVFYYGSIIFTSATDKGFALAEFLQKFPEKELPGKIVFVDDLKDNIDAVKALFVNDLESYNDLKSYIDIDALKRIRSSVKEVSLFHYTRVASERGGRPE
jgi:hypothetical protein